ncbi:divergent polysaccharide deacetylase family protein [Hyphococcus sp.]|uniref:divergent polysaccharide deacetylase family protein n=1 Tax=Hyphococcus sp. TaxID=2038636 RepID=UPI00207F9DCD|nr:MAG: hypothetical protein DHS20C04_19670 [Marinicaulis sp.]
MGRIALPIDRIEMFARNNASEAGEERIAAPALRDSQTDNTAHADIRDAVGDEEDDGLVLIYPGEDDLFAENEDDLLYDDVEPYSVDDVVITIAGGNKRATAVSAAALTPVIRPVADADEALLRSTALGKVPRISPDGRKAVSYYRSSFEGGGAKPRVAIVVGGLGLNSAVTERAIDDLPPEISLSFAPYAKNLDFWTRKARQAGHEVLIELPMEGYGASTQALGAAGLLSTRTPEENLQRLDWLMARFGAYFAATNYMGAKFSADEASIAPILAKLKESGVGYIDDTGAAARVAGSLPMATVSRMIPAAPDDQDLRAVKRELSVLEKIAERDGFALGKTYAYAATIDEIARWSKTLEEKGFVAAPASALLRSATASR